ncbi:MAG: hypothetical protein HY355_02295 [Armatimonadetes bacterium]|nr:hypothetical protein [Armatimonadota bacterium]
MNARRRLWPTMLAAVVWLAASCGPRAADVAGVWEGTWTSADRQSTGTFRVDVQQRGKTIGGSISLSLDWLPYAQINGVVEGQRVRWGVLREKLVVLTFDGHVNQEMAQGTYAFGSASEGTWTARRVRR